MKSFRYAAGAATGLLAVAMCVSVSVSAQDQRRIMPTLRAASISSNARRLPATAGPAVPAIRTPPARCRPKMRSADLQRIPTTPCSFTMAATTSRATAPRACSGTPRGPVEIPLPPNVSLADDPGARTVVLRRGIPTTLNTPALDPVLMSDGRQPSLEAQAMGAIHDHGQASGGPSGKELERLVAFEKSDPFFSSPALRAFARTGPAPALPDGVTESERRGKRFFEDVVDFSDLKHGACAACHSGPMLNETNQFAELAFGVPKGTRFQTIGVSEINVAQNPVRCSSSRATMERRYRWLRPILAARSSPAWHHRTIQPSRT